MKTRKIITILMSALLLMSFAGCKADKDKIPEETRETADAIIVEAPDDLVVEDTKTTNMDKDVREYERHTAEDRSNGEFHYDALMDGVVLNRNTSEHIDNNNDASKGGEEDFIYRRENLRKG